MSRYYIYDTYTDSVAEFARGDKKEDNRARNAAIVAGGAGAAGAIGAGVRYGGAQLATNRAINKYGRGSMAAGVDRASIAKTFGDGAMGQVRRDVAGARTAIGNQYSRAKSGGKKAVGTIAKAAKGGYGTKGRLALGLGALTAAGTVAGAGYAGVAGKKAYDKKQKEKRSIKGRIKSLLGR